MISYLIGKPIIEKDYLTMLCGQVGYAVHVTGQTLSQLAGQSEIQLHIYTHVKEEVLELYGFPAVADRELFLLLIGVSGVGPKTALHILNLGTDALIEAVQQANPAFFVAAPRVGKKLAQKIIIDLRSKLGAIKDLNLAPLSVARQEVLLALQSLGFDEFIASEKIKDLAIEEMTTSEAIKQAIKLMSGKGA